MEGSLENLARPLRTTDEATESQENRVIHYRSWRSHAPTQNFLDPIPLLSELDCPRCLHTYACLVHELASSLLTALLTENTDIHILKDTD